MMKILVNFLLFIFEEPEPANMHMRLFSALIYCSFDISLLALAYASFKACSLSLWDIFTIVHYTLP